MSDDDLYYPGLKIEEPRVSVTLYSQHQMGGVRDVEEQREEKSLGPTREERYRKFIQTLREKLAPGQGHLNARDILVRSKRLLLLQKAKSLKVEQGKEVNGFPKRAHFLGLIN